MCGDKKAKTIQVAFEKNLINGPFICANADVQRNFNFDGSGQSYFRLSLWLEHLTKATVSLSFGVNASVGMHLVDLQKSLDAGQNWLPPFLPGGMSLHAMKSFISASEASAFSKLSKEVFGQLKITQKDLLEVSAEAVNEQMTRRNGLPGSTPNLPLADTLFQAKDDIRITSSELSEGKGPSTISLRMTPDAFERWTASGSPSEMVLAAMERNGSLPEHVKTNFSDSLDSIEAIPKSPSDESASEIMIPKGSMSTSFRPAAVLRKSVSWKTIEQ